MPLLALVVAACSGVNDTQLFVPGGGSAGEGGSNAGSSGASGSAGTNAGSGGASAGSGGSSAGSAGTSSGSGGSSAGAGGSSAGTGGSSAGSGGSDPGEVASFGVGDPWFFDEASELDDFQVEFLDGATGSASWSEPGEIHVTATFAEAADKVHVHFISPWDGSQNAPLDLSNWSVVARVRVAQDTTATGGLQLFAQSVGWTWASSDWQSFGDFGSATDIEFDFANATDGTKIVKFGLQIYGTSAGNAHIVIDEIRLVPKEVVPEPDAGPGVEQDAGSQPPGEEDAGATPNEDAGTDPGEDPGSSPDAGSPSPDSGAGGSGGGLGYEPLGLGDPWLFTDSSEVSAFAAAGATATWEAPGQVRLSGDLAVNTSMAFQFTTPWNGSTNTPIDMTGRVLRARVRFGEGSTAQGGVQAFAQTAGWTWTTGNWNGVSGLGSFADVELELNATPDASQVLRVGVQFYATSAGTADLIIDEIRIEPAD